MLWSLGIPIDLIQKSSLSSVNAVVAVVGGSRILHLSICLSLEGFGWCQCSGKVWRALKLPYWGEERQKPLTLYPAGWKLPRNGIWCRGVKAGAQSSPLPRSNLRAQPPEDFGPDPQMYTQHLHPRGMEGSQTPGDLSWAYLFFHSPQSLAAKVSFFSTKPHSNRLNEALTSHGQERLHAARGVHSLCGAALEALQVNAPYLIIESLRQFPYSIPLCVSATNQRIQCLK